MLLFCVVPAAQIPELNLLVRAAYNKLPSSFDEDGSPVEATHAHALCQGSDYTKFDTHRVRPRVYSDFRSPSLVASHWSPL